MKTTKSSLLAKASIATILMVMPPFSWAENAQHSKSATNSRVLVSTWKAGNATVREKSVRLSMKRGFQGYEFSFSDTSKQRQFRLSFEPVIQETLTRSNIPCWSAVLREVTTDIKFGGSIVGFNLLSPQGPGVGHYFPREGWAGFFCPIEKPNRVVDGLFYAIKSERVFLIERFLVSIRATDYQYDKKENTFNSLDIAIEIKNQ